MSYEYVVKKKVDLHVGPHDAMILAVAHNRFIGMWAEVIRQYGKAEQILYDIKSALPKDKVDGRL